MEFDILDDANSNDNDDESYSSDSSGISLTELDAMLEAGLQNKNRKSTSEENKKETENENLQHEEKEKVILKGKCCYIRILFSHFNILKGKKKFNYFLKFTTL